MLSAKLLNRIHSVQSRVRGKRRRSEKATSVNRMLAGLGNKKCKKGGCILNFTALDYFILFIYLFFFFSYCRELPFPPRRLTAWYTLLELDNAISKQRVCEKGILFFCEGNAASLYLGRCLAEPSPPQWEILVDFQRLSPRTEFSNQQKSAAVDLCSVCGVDVFTLSLSRSTLHEIIQDELDHRERERLVNVILNPRG